MDSTKVLNQNIANVFWDYIYTNYVTNPVFLSMIFVIFFLLWVMRVFVFDNKNLKVNSKSWFYPLTYFLICAFVVWLKGGLMFSGFKQYLNDFLTQLAATTILYTAFGHKAIEFLSKKAGKQLGLIETPPNTTP